MQALVPPERLLVIKVGEGETIFHLSSGNHHLPPKYNLLSFTHQFTRNVMIIMMVCGARAYGRKILCNYVIQVFCHHHHIEDDGLVGNDCDDKVDGNVYLLNQILPC